MKKITIVVFVSLLSMTFPSWAENYKISALTIWEKPPAGWGDTINENSRKTQFLITMNLIPRPQGNLESGWKLRYSIASGIWQDLTIENKDWGKIGRYPGSHHANLWFIVDAPNTKFPIRIQLISPQGAITELIGHHFGDNF